MTRGDHSGNYVMSNDNSVISVSRNRPKLSNGELMVWKELMIIQRRGLGRVRYLHWYGDRSYHPGRGAVEVQSGET